MRSYRPSFQFAREWRNRRRGARADKQRRHVERMAAQQNALRGRDEHTGGYGDPPY